MAKEPNIRKVVTYVETIFRENGQELAKPIKKVVASAVVKNPYAGVYQEDLSEIYEYGEYLGHFLTDKGVTAMNIPVEEVHSFGKACIVGIDGEHEHAAAMMHPKLGAPMRAYLGAGKAVIPSAKKIAAAGSSLDVPLLHKDAMLLRSHYDSIEIKIEDAPHGDEIMVCTAFSNGGRPLARVGGFTVDEIKGQNGLD